METAVAMVVPNCSHSGAMVFPERGERGDTRRFSSVMAGSIS